MSELKTLHLFQAFGVEVEYMIVDAETLDVKPITDRAIEAVAGEIASEVDLDGISWSNELVAHVIELKATEPTPDLAALSTQLQRNVARINGVLAPLGGVLLPSAMHPWIDPHREMTLWAHDYGAIYAAFDRIFDCRGHGWANLQSAHLNLPFAGDDEFGRLHAAIRVLLPLLPALAASSPYRDGGFSGLMDGRLDVYRGNSRRLPSVAGLVIPEPVFSEAAYQSQILERIYADVAPLDLEGTLQHEWLNARGAIARFDRSAIEIRVVDVQECPQADVAICALVADVLEQLVAPRWTDLAELQSWSAESLAAILTDTIRDAERTVVDQPAYLRLFGINARKTTAADVWQHLAEAAGPSARSRAAELQQALNVILNRGPLARRLVAILKTNPTRDQLREVYGELSRCLGEGRMFG